MSKKLITAIILIAVLCAMADARTPQIGDKVKIGANAGSFYAKYNGTITDIENGLICMKCDEASVSGTIYVRPGDEPVDVCIGIGSIIAIIWPDEVK
jgi:hypothetical protein